MNMTFDQYIQNPMGVKNAVFSHREMYRTMYNEKLSKILLREVGKVDYKTFIDKDKYYLYMKIPSEVVPKFYYDVVIEFYTNNPLTKNSKSLKDYNIKFFSNDPSFVFTFAHAMLKNDLFVRDMIPRMSKEAVKNAAKVKNPNKEIGYVKSIYFTYLLMKSYSLFDKIVFENKADKYHQKSLLNMIVHSDIKIKDRQEKGKEEQQRKSAEKRKDKENKVKDTTPIDKVVSKNKTSSIKTISKTKTIGSINKKSANMNTIKKVKRR